MRILLPSHQALAAGGIQTFVRGLVPAMRGALGAGEELFVLSPKAGSGPLARALAGTYGPVGAAARLAFEQVVVPYRAPTCDSIHLCDMRPILASRRPAVLTVHDVSYLDDSSWSGLTAATYKRAMLSAAIARRPAAVVCDSEHTRERLLLHEPSAARLDVRVVHPGVSEPPADRPVRRADEREPYFLTVGAIEPRKNHRTLLRAYRRARAEGLELRWKVAGAAGRRSGAVVAELHAEEGVDVLGWVPQERLEHLYAGALFVAVPSHLEGFGYVPLEAMARGVATICSLGTGLDETVGDSGLRPPAAEVDAWATALLRLQDDVTERARLEQAGRERVARFGWARAGASLVELHRNLHTHRHESR